MSIIKLNLVNYFQQWTIKIDHKITQNIIYPSPWLSNELNVGEVLPGVDFELAPGARLKSLPIPKSSLSKLGNFHWFKRDCWLVWKPCPLCKKQLK